MKYKIFGEFDSTELAELASGRLKEQYPAAENILVTPKVNQSAINAKKPPIAFPMLSGPVSGYGMIWDDGNIGISNLPEPYGTKEAVLSFEIDEKYANGAEGLLTSLGGLGVRH